MAKKVAVIDIGSNSIRMAIYAKTSRFAFHLLYETKSRVRLSENAYQNNGNLQAIPMQRTFDALREFLEIIASFNVRKTLCVATSALRDAPNKQEFLTLIKKQLKLNIKVINGEKEAYLGSMACANLLPKQENAISIDIGGGSTEFSYIDSDSITKSFSLELGTVRIKELFFDSNKLDEAIEYIDNKLLYISDLSPTTLIGIGGTFRSISSAIMHSIEYPLNKIHGFECLAQDFIDYIEKILYADEKALHNLGIKKNRFDVIKPGVLILQRVFKKLSIQNTITSGVGVREGVYLSDLLRNSKDKFPHNYNTSVRYLIDANIPNTSYANQLSLVSKKLFDLTFNHIGVNQKFRYDLSIASKLYPSGRSIHFFSQNRHTYYLIKSALEYGFTHSQIMLIATLTRYAKNKLPSQKHVAKYHNLLPDSKTINYLSYLISLSIALLSHKPRNIDFDLSFSDGKIKVESTKPLYLSREALKKVSEIKDLEIIF
ncbi:MAG: exopolyphosphatase/guanosine-5'-triphosphate,3'-diphosphate pyrophosphatase [Sulfurimonas sp.]|jgi:exopolyphosphatase/guanosine-5'-triphosphate,3'-diphosphate pyrophosphatase|uniref:Ppx/GppA phosphatase family protein n=1 Tax=Sulfurimonas sp. TaxID=2022749 RepID=UPI0039E3E7B1